jgi:cardiolipin synthase
MSMCLLVDSNEFWSSLQKDIRSSKDHIYIQTLSFEGDQAGRTLSNELLSSRTKDIRVLVDAYTKYVINDRFLYTPKNYLDSDLQMEKAHTIRMFEELDKSGVKVRLTNPVGFLFTRFPVRNHKKMILIDDHVSYIGGINFSEHNFEWHDSMIRIDDAGVASFLRSDFLSSWQGLHVYAEKAFKGLQLYLYDGRCNERCFQTIFRMIEEAESSILIESPYITFPFYERLTAAGRRGVTITLIAPATNNRRDMAKYTLWEAKRACIDLWLYQPGMTHLKAMLIDARILILGSTNFDYISYKTEQELVAVITEEAIIDDFKRRVVEVDMQNSTEFVGQVSYRRGLFHYLALKALGKTLVFLAKLSSSHI